MGNIITDIQSLSPDELKAVGRLIQKFVKRKDNDNTERPKQRHKPNDIELDDEVQVGRDKPRVSSTEQNKFGRGKTNPTNQRKAKRIGITETVRLSGKNEYLNSPEYKNAAKQDSKIDKLLWRDRTPIQRRDTFEPLEVQCKVCNKYYDVNPNIVLCDEDTGEPNYTCNNCSRKQ